MNSIANSTSYMFLDKIHQNILKYILYKKHSQNGSFWKFHFLLPSCSPLPIPNSLVLEEWVSSRSVDIKIPTNDKKEFNKKFEDTSRLLLLIWMTEKDSSKYLRRKFSSKIGLVTQSFTVHSIG